MSKQCLQDIDALIIVVVGHCLAFHAVFYAAGVVDGCIQIRAGAADEHAAVGNGVGGRQTGHGCLDAEQGLYGRNRRVVVEAERQAVGGCPARGADVVGAAGTKEDVGVALAVVVDMVDKEGGEQVLGCHVVGQLVHGRILEHSPCRVVIRLVGVIREPAPHLLGHVGVHVGVVAHQALNVLAFQGLGMNGGMTGIRDLRILCHGHFQGLNPDFGATRAVGVNFGAYAVSVEKVDEAVHVAWRNVFDGAVGPDHGIFVMVLGAYKCAVVAIAVHLGVPGRAVFCRVAAPVVVAGGLQPGRVALR